MRRCVGVFACCLCCLFVFVCVLFVFACPRSRVRACVRACVSCAQARELRGELAAEQRRNEEAVAALRAAEQARAASESQVGCSRTRIFRPRASCPVPRTPCSRYVCFHVGVVTTFTSLCSAACIDLRRAGRASGAALSCAALGYWTD
jgi:hypothetical protein